MNRKKNYTNKHTSYIIVKIKTVKRNKICIVSHILARNDRHENGSVCECEREKEIQANEDKKREAKKSEMRSNENAEQKHVCVQNAIHL